MEEPTRLHSVSKFYFLEYFYVLLESVEKYSTMSSIFNSFRVLKEEHRLGESKYKVKKDVENLSDIAVNRYIYTFLEVLNEASEYNLVTIKRDQHEDEILLTDEGYALLTQYKTEGPLNFNRTLLGFMEDKYNAFRYFIEFLYNKNKFKPGLLILPNYSPRQLYFERSSIKNTNDIVAYSNVLVNKLEEDIKKHLGETRQLAEKNDQLITKLIESGLLSSDRGEPFDQKKYNVIIKRFRDYWTTFFLQEIYNFRHSLSTFDIWIYRGKQIGIVHATEFYPNFHGRVIYPTSVVMANVAEQDFKCLKRYKDGMGLYVHEPVWEEQNQQQFVKCLVDGYFDLGRIYRSYFINLMALRELVCYNMKISESLFDSFLEQAYKMNLAGNLRVKISLEVDKLPEETKALYLKQQPVMVDGRYRNIIAIDIAKG